MYLFDGKLPTEIRSVFENGRNFAITANFISIESAIRLVNVGAAAKVRG